MLNNCYMEKTSILIIISLILASSCGDDVIEIPEPDRTPPVATIISPVHGDTIFSNMLFKVHATDNDKVKSIVFIVNEDTIGKTNNKTDDIFVKFWNADSVDLNGNRLFTDDEFHSLSFVATDPAEINFVHIR